MILMIDNYDSFVYNLVRYIRELNEEVIVYKNDKITIEEIKQLNPEGIIISPGPKHPKDARISLECVSQLGDTIPILGICLGHQVIGHIFGAKVIQGRVPVHGKVTPIYHDGSGVFHNCPSPFMATRYHSLVILSENLPDCLEATAFSEDGVIMGIRHKFKPIEGVQFHPEAELTQHGHLFLANFIKRCKEPIC